MYNIFFIFQIILRLITILNIKSCKENKNICINYIPDFYRKLYSLQGIKYLCNYYYHSIQVVFIFFLLIIFYHFFNEKKNNIFL